MSKQIPNIILFSLLALGSYAVIKYFFDEEEKIQDQPFTKGYAIEDLEMRITDKNGQFSAVFQSPSLVRYTDNPLIYVEKPLFWLYTKGKKSWQVVADKAQYNVDDESINFIEKVKAQSLNKKTQSELLAKDLLINLKNKIATTQNGIQLRQANLTMRGQKAQFDLQNNILEVNNNVKAVYKTKN